MKRYFIIFFDCKNERKWAKGSFDVSTDNGRHFQLDKLAERYLQTKPDLSAYFSPNELTITNFIELSESDYMDYSAPTGDQ